MKSPIKLTLMLSLVCTTALAEDTIQGFALGPARVFPGFEFTLKQDSNILQQHDDEISSFVTLWNPQVKLEGKKQSYLYDLAWETEIGRYLSSAADNYEDMLLSALQILNGKTEKVNIEAPRFISDKDACEYAGGIVHSTLWHWRKQGLQSLLV